MNWSSKGQKNWKILNQAKIDKNLIGSKKFSLVLIRNPTFPNSMGSLLFILVLKVIVD